MNIGSIIKKRCSPLSLRGYTIKFEKAKEYRDRGKLLTMRLETSRICNLRCIYCNNDAGSPGRYEITFDEIKGVILQVKNLGAESVVIIGGGEPLLYRNIKELIKYIVKLGMIPVIITNGTNITKEMLSFLWENEASVLLKCDSFKEEVQDILADQKGTYKAIMNTINLIIKQGLNKRTDKEQLRIGLSFVATRLNFKDIPLIWNFCRKNELYPNYEEFIPRGRGLKNYEILFLDRKEVSSLKEELLSIDHTYGYDWLSYAPLLGHGCFQTLCSIYLSSDGKVRPCPDIEVTEFSIRDNLISEIINTPFFKLARNIEKHLKGKCGGCDNKYNCIGCRGNAFTTGILNGLSPEEAICSEDPLCGRKLDELSL